MVVVMERNAPEEAVQTVVERLGGFGFGAHVSRGVERTIVGAIGTGDKEEAASQLEALPHVERVVIISRPFKLVSREHQPETSVVCIGDAYFGRGRLGVIAGPCSVEDRGQVLEAARGVKAGGGHCLRGGTFKPRSSPYDFQGLGAEGVALLLEARAATGLPVVTEVTDARQLDLMVESGVDAVQIGARNMHNYELLKAAGSSPLPVVLKRGLAATVQEWLRAAEYVAGAGNLNIILCERGIRTFENETRFTLDLGGMAAAKLETHLPIIVDPSHATGKRRLVQQMALAGIAAGADGLMIEVHPHPDLARSDGPQSVPPAQFETIMESVRRIASCVGKEL